MIDVVSKLNNVDYSRLLSTYKVTIETEYPHTMIAIDGTEGYIKIYGNDYSAAIDITEYIEDIKWSENDLDSPNSGRTLDGLMHRGKVTSKNRADVKLVPLEASKIIPIMQVLRNEYFGCETDLLPTGGVTTMTMYNSTRSGGIAIITTDGKVKHKDVSFNMIQR